ncbi:MAG: cupin domain-containing protein [Gammaproteobacteria bacterium]|nr:cupin domain-containing protein [Gammaproteobacteria bacterium]
MSISLSRAQMEARRVRYGELRPCTTAFVDTRTPGSDRKENFTIIGPGVAENPDQFVHITIPHGFNIGGARQPPRCVNSQHSHETAEVFVVHSGIWRFKTGVDGTDGHVDLGPGDVISIPTHAFRGFENIGDDVGFLFAVLGGDDPGRVTWAPYVFEAATRYGLVLLQDGRLIDTTRQSVPAGAVPMRPPTAAELAAFDRYDSAAIARCTVRASEFRPAGGLSDVEGFAECPIVGVANDAERSPAAPLAWAHGFQVRALAVRPGAKSPAHARREEEVLFVQQGRLTVEWADGSLTLDVGDTFSAPKGLVRVLRNESASEARLYVVRGGDHPAAAQVVSDLRASG